MIPDKVFKELNHNHAEFNIYKNGQTLDEGYKPDYVLKNGNEFIILESENSSSRKTFVGGMIKAAHFLQEERKGKLIFVIVRKKNVTAENISRHLRKYLTWISSKTNLREIYVIETLKYYDGENVIALDCENFLECAVKV